MGRLAVVAQRLAVIGEVHDHGVATQSQRVERRQKPRDLGIGVHDLAGVGGRRAAAVIVRRHVRVVRIVEVNPEVERALGAPWLPQPGDRRLHYRFRGSFDVGKGAALEPGIVEGVVVGLVTLTNAPAGMEHVGRDEPSGPVAGCLKTLRKGGGVLSQDEARVVAHGVVWRVEPREERRVRRQRQRHLRDSVLEHHALPRQPRGRGRLERRAVRREVIATQRVDGDHDDVGLSESRALRRRMDRRPNAAGERRRRLVRLDATAGARAAR